jgi:hypothetical protein
LLAEIDRGETTSTINAYVVQEALAAGSASLPPRPTIRLDRTWGG